MILTDDDWSCKPEAPEAPEAPLHSAANRNPPLSCHVTANFTKFLVNCQLNFSLFLPIFLWYTPEVGGIGKYRIRKCISGLRFFKDFSKLNGNSALCKWVACWISAPSCGIFRHFSAFFRLTHWLTHWLTHPVTHSHTRLPLIHPLLSKPANCNHPNWLIHTHTPSYTPSYTPTHNVSNCSFTHWSNNNEQLIR